MSSRELFDAARRALPLPEVWNSYGLPMTKKATGRFESSYTPCCGTHSRDDSGSLFCRRDDTWAWNCFKCGQGGSVIDLVSRMDNITPTEAAKKLVGDAGGIQAITGRPPTPPRQRVTLARRRDAVGKVVAAIRSSNNMDKIVARYLYEKRGFTEATVSEARQRGFLRCLSSFPDSADTWLRLNLDEDTLRDAGLVKSGPRVVRSAAAYRPVVFLPPGDTCIEFRTIAENPSGPKALQYGEQIYPLIWKPSGEVRKILVVEGGFDVLAAVDLGFAVNTLIVGQFGTSAWDDRWTYSIRKKYPDALWQIGTDLDRAGNDALERFSESLTGVGARWERLAPWGGGKDWNDTLLSARSF